MKISVAVDPTYGFTYNNPDRQQEHRISLAIGFDENQNFRDLLLDSLKAVGASRKFGAALPNEVERQVQTMLDKRK